MWCNSRSVNPSAAAVAARRFANANAREMAATCLKLAADNAEEVEARRRLRMT